MGTGLGDLPAASSMGARTRTGHSLPNQDVPWKTPVKVLSCMSTRLVSSLQTEAF